MNDRIALLIKAKNITPSQLADELGIQRSGVSHIMNNRNKPSLEFIQRLLKKYPDISMKWILFGEGQMMNPYPVQNEPVESNVDTKKIAMPAKPLLFELFPPEDNDDDSKPTEIGLSLPEEVVETTESQLYSSEKTENSDVVNFTSEKSEVEKEKENRTEIKTDPGLVQKSDGKERIESATEKINPATQGNGRKIDKIVIFYSDRTFVEYHPEPEN